MKLNNFQTDVSRFILPLLLFMTVLLFFTKDIIDPDLPWHIATGKYILNTFELPSSDPFSAPMEGETLPFVGKFVLSQYWLSQIFLASISQIFGVTGLIFLQGSIFATIAILIQQTLRTKGPLFSYIITIAYVLYPIHQSFYSIRPVSFTFLLLTFLLYFLIKHHQLGSTRYVLFLPPLFLVWSNIHGGFIIGLIVFLFYFLQHLYLSVQKFQTTPTGFYLIFSVFVISVIASALNPNQLNAFIVAMNHSYTDSYENFEILSPFNPIQRFQPYIVGFWISLPINFILSIYFFRRRYIFPLLLLVFTTYMSLTAVRYIPLMLIAVGFSFTYIDFSLVSIDRLLRTKVVLPFILILLVAFRLHFVKPSKNWVDNFIYSPNAVKFLKENNINGSIFSSFNKSSFLLMELYPQSTVFVDSRYLYPHRVKLVKQLSGASPSLHKERSLLIQRVLQPSNSLSEENLQKADREKDRVISLLNSTNTDIIVHEALQIFDGKLYNLPLCLYLSGQWALVYSDGHVLIYLKRNEKFHKKIMQLELSNYTLFDEILKEVSIGLSKTQTPFYYTSLAFGLLGKNSNDHYIESAINAAISMNSNQETTSLLSDILQKRKLH